ncbi:hypothetical protein NHH03_07345 [Stieleria sp. TO1_6]|uniref:hypothetical protein n=1 Tax=Stieleria tagensis TaxID=2956795 RepID=UPI00209AA614|nr:hypothetical protein [Stieleria tagensis]MCO8121545.1 hypothetical protein [Stieleria tagensis]
MAIRAKRIDVSSNRVPSWFRVHPGQAFEGVFKVCDSQNGQPVNWSEQRPLFRVYSQFVDRSVVVEVADPARCRFEPNGIWKLRLTAEETQAMPHGGMRFTVEHQQPSGDSRILMQGGISCCKKRSRRR